jgi:hypothetical protein
LPAKLSLLGTGDIRYGLPESDNWNTETNVNASWTFLSNHAHVLLCIARNSDSRLRDVAEQVGITERAVQKIVSELEEGGALTRMRDGRRNSYVIHVDCPLRHPIEHHQTVGKLLSMCLTPAQIRSVRARSKEHDNE